MLEKIFEKGLSLNEFGAEVANKNKKYYLDSNNNDNSKRQLLENESQKSHKRQKELDNNKNDISFQKFKKNYFIK